MRRSISNELLVALLAAVSLVFAAVFAVVLSTSTAPRPTAVETATRVASIPAISATPGPTDIPAISTTTSATPSPTPTEAVGTATVLAEATTDYDRPT